MSKPNLADTCPECLNLVATFTPEAWVNDEAIPVDLEGSPSDYKWDPYPYLKKDPRLLRGIVADVKADGDWLDKNDVLRDDPHLPSLAKRHQGPFTIRVELRRYKVHPSNGGLGVIDTWQGGNTVWFQRGRVYGKPDGRLMERAEKAAQKLNGLDRERR